MVVVLEKWPGRVTPSTLIRIFRLEAPVSVRRSAEQEDPSVPHRNAPLSVEGRRRLIARCRHRPIAHVAAEMGISRHCAGKWVNRHRRHGETGLADQPSVPHHQPTATPRTSRADRAVAPRPEVLSPPDQHPTRQRGHHHLDPDRQPSPRAPGPEPPAFPRPHRRDQPSSTHDCRGKSAARLQTPSWRHQRHDLIQLEGLL